MRIVTNAFVIKIVGLPLSERSAARCIERARAYGLEVEPFPATTRYAAESTLRAEGLSLNRRIYAHISDDPIGDRDMVAVGRWHITTPEIGCAMSHYRLWKLCMEIDEPVIVLEHDVWLVAPPPPLVPGFLALSFHNSAMGGTLGYIITPQGARMAIAAARKEGIQPADELLFRATFRERQAAYCDPAVVAYDETEPSTIQFTRSDRIHRRTPKIDPWVEYVPPATGKDR
jgi:hypothetical protein